MLRTSASELEKIHRKKKKNPDPGFSGELTTPPPLSVVVRFQVSLLSILL